MKTFVTVLVVFVILAFVIPLTSCSSPSSERASAKTEGVVIINSGSEVVVSRTRLDPKDYTLLDCVKHGNDSLYLYEKDTTRVQSNLIKQ